MSAYSTFDTCIRLWLTY